MPITISCPNPACDASSVVGDSIGGRSVKCKKCGKPFVAQPTFDGQKHDTKKSRPSVVENPFPELPAEFGRYRVLRMLGKGGMGAVYLAEDSQLGRQVALKLPFFDPKESPARIERFSREARSAAVLHHPNICTVFDAGQIDGRPFITMAYLPGTPLEQQIGGPVPMAQSRAAEIARKIALALEHAHIKGTVHRDLKPANVMVMPDGEPVVMDFGLAKLMAKPDPNEAKLTRDGGIIGTPSYMSPEQVRGDARTIGAPTDIYSLGVLLFEMVAGTTPYSGPIGAVLGQILSAPVPQLSEFREDADPRLDAICQKAMAKEPHARYRNMAEFSEALGQYLAPATSSPARSAIMAAPIPMPEMVNVSLVEEDEAEEEATPEPDKYSPSRKAAAKGRRWNPAVFAGIAAGLLGLGLLALWAGGAFKVKTKEGTIELTELAEDSEVFVDGEKVTVAWDKGRQTAEIRVKAGTHKVEVRKGGFTAFGEEVSLDDKGKKVLVARLTKAPPAVLEKPGAVADPDRMAAKYILSIGGIVRIDGSDNWIGDPARLPVEPFRLTWVAANENQELTDEGIANLKGCSHLIAIQFPGCKKITDTGMAHLAQCEEVVELHLDDTAITDAGLLNFKDRKSLRTVLLARTDVTDVGMRQFKDCSAVRWLDLSGTRVDDEGLANFQNCKKLEALRVHDTKTSDIGLAYFHDCQNLMGLEQKNSKITDAGRAKFLKARPSCRVDWNPLLAAAEQPNPPAEAGEFVPLFNGKDLIGWEGLPGLWKFDNGILTGTTPKALDFNTCLCSKKKYRDFELTCQVRIKDGTGNSGIQIRSAILDRPQFRVKGPQADMGDEFWGSLYGEADDGMMKAAPKEIVEKSLKKRDFNDYSVKVVGSRVTIKLNGETTVDDEFPKMAGEGIIAFQLHGKFAGQEVAFKDIRIREIKDNAAENSPDVVVPPPQGVGRPIPPSVELVALKREAIPAEALKWAGNGDTKKAPARLVAVLGDPQPRQNGFVEALVYSPDGRWLASGCEDKTVVLRDAASGRVVRLLAGHTGGVRGIGFGKDSKTLATSSTDGTIRFWPVDRAAEPLVVRPGIGEIWGLAISADGRFLAAGGTTGGVKLWKWGQWDAPLKLADDPKKPLSSVKAWKDNASLALSPDGQHLAVRTQENKEDAPVYLFKTADGKLDKTLPGVWVGDDRVYWSMWMSFSTDGKSLLSFSSGKGTAIWNVATGKRTADYASDQFGAIALSPNGEMVALVRNFTIGVEIYDRETQKKERVIGHGNNDGMSVTFAPDGKTLATGFYDGTVISWDTATWERKYLVNGHADNVNSIEFAGDGKSVLSTGHDSTVRRWDLGKPGQNRIANKVEARLRAAAASPDGQRYATLVAPLGFEAVQTCVIWDAATDRQAVSVEQPLGLHRVVFSPDGKLLAGSTLPVQPPTNGDTFVGLWDAETGTEVHRFPHLGDGQHCAPTFSSDGKLLAVASPEQLKLVLVESGKEVRTWADSKICVAAFRPDGGLVATGHTDGSISYWDPRAAKKKKAVTGHAGKVMSLKFTPDGKTLVSSGEDGTIRLWNPGWERASEVIAYGPPNGRVMIDLDPSGKYIVAGGNGTAIGIFRLAAAAGPIGDPKEKPAAPMAKVDPFQGNSVWASDDLNVEHVLTVTERKGDRFKARLLAGPGITRDVTGTVKDGKLVWLAKDVVPVKGGQGGDNSGTFAADEKGERIDFDWTLPGGTKGAFTLRLHAGKIESKTAVDPDRTAAEYVLSVGGQVWIGDDYHEIRAVVDLPKEPLRVTAVVLSRNDKVKDAGLAAFAGCKHIKKLHLFETGPVTDVGLSYFKDCKDMEELHLQDQSKIGDAGMAYFEGCTKIRRLRLHSTKVTDKGLAYFKDCKGLEGLELRGNDVSDLGLAHFQGCKKVVILSLHRTRVTDKGLANFQDSKGLKTLDLTALPVSDKGLAYFKGCPVVELFLNQCSKISDTGVAHFDLTFAEIFHLDDTQVSDKTLAGLKNAVRLTYLGLYRTKVTATGVEVLKKELPQCRVGWESVEK